VLREVEQAPVRAIHLFDPVVRPRRLSRRNLIQAGSEGRHVHETRRGPDNGLQRRVGRKTGDAKLACDRCKFRIARLSPGQPIT
jgi:hypothetical protein